MIAGVKTEPVGSIRRINVEIPPLSVSDMRRLKATDKVGTFVLFQETYHRPTFKTMHPTGPKSDYDYRVLTQVRGGSGGEWEEGSWRGGGGRLVAEWARGGRGRVLSGEAAAALYASRGRAGQGRGKHLILLC